MSKRTIKQVIFNDKEQPLLDWVESKDKSFSSYMKDLIRDDIKKHSLNDIGNLESIVKDIISKMNVEVKTVETKKQHGLGTKSKAAYKNILKK